MDDDVPTRIFSLSASCLKLARSTLVMPELRTALCGKADELRHQLDVLEQELTRALDLTDDGRAVLALEISEGRLDLLFADGTADEHGPTSLRLARTLRRRT